MGRRDAVAAARRHPLARALRIDKLSLAALEATLRLYRDPERRGAEIPVLAMLFADPDTLAARAERIAGGDRRAGADRHGRGQDRRRFAAAARARGAGGGARRPTRSALARALRPGEPPVIARIHDGRVLLDPRTLTER